jgi:SAM-dependent MidA family methyltransferase
LNPLADILGDEVRKHGVISFTRFMEAALYCPLYGYYGKKKGILGRDGDYFTSVNIGGLFGELLAFQFAEWIAGFPIDDCRLAIVEGGAHDGRLAADILSWLGRWRADVFEKVEYLIVEPSETRRAWQQERLAAWSGKVGWLAEMAELGADQKSKLENQRSFAGIIFSNELLDAMPVRRLGWDAQRREWFEWGVAVEKERFVWARIPISKSETRNPKVPEELAALLPDGFTTEISPAAEDWWRGAAGILRAGKLMAIDYGLSAEEFFAPERSRGTLRTYHRHQAGGDLLADVGAQDITAHVNFTRIQAAGESAGLKTQALISQEKFLVQIAEQIAKRPNGFDEWDAKRARQFQTLTHPEHLGRPFRVLIQSR